MSLGLLLTACGALTGSGKTDPPQFGAIPPKLKKRCADPVVMPERDLTKAETEFYHGKDRKSLVLCRDKDAGLVKFIEDRDRRIGGNK